MSKIQKITCDDCGRESEISFEILGKHEQYWMDHKGVITAGTNSFYDGKLVKESFNLQDVEEIMGDCEDCGNAGATVLLEDGTSIPDDDLDAVLLWSIL